MSAEYCTRCGIGMAVLSVRSVLGRTCYQANASFSGLARLYPTFFAFLAAKGKQFCRKAGMRSQPAPHLRHDLLAEDLQLVEGEAVQHPRPMHRRDDVVDPEPPVQSDHLVGDFGRRPEQKPILEQFVETVVEIVPRLHDLVLLPC